MASEKNGTGANLFRASLALLQALILGILFYLVGRIDKIDDRMNENNAAVSSRLATIEWRLDHNTIR